MLLHKCNLKKKHQINQSLKPISHDSFTVWLIKQFQLTTKWNTFWNPNWGFLQTTELSKKLRKNVHVNYSYRNKTDITLPVHPGDSCTVVLTLNVLPLHLSKPWQTKLQHTEQSVYTIHPYTGTATVSYHRDKTNNTVNQRHTFSVSVITSANVDQF